MTKTFKDPNPQLSWLEDSQVKKQIAAQAQRALELAEKLQRFPLNAEEIEAAQRQAEQNAYAEENPLYAAARSASMNFLVLPLDGVKPLVPIEQATNEPHRLFEWWSEYPEANSGVRLGRVGGLFALLVEDRAAHDRLRQMAAVEQYDPDLDRRYIEYRELGGAPVRFMAPSQPVTVRARAGWGREYQKAVAQMIREGRERNPQTFLLTYGYPSVPSGQDAFDYKARTVAPGVKVLGEGDTLPWDGAILADGDRVVAPSSRPPECPLWLAKMIGKPRSRKAMAAAREQHEATVRRDESHIIGRDAARRREQEEAYAKAESDRLEAERILAEVMEKNNG